MEDTEATWNAMAQDYEGFSSPEESFSEAMEVPCVESLLPPLHGLRVLDLGCGTGRFTFLLAGRGAREVLGVDLSSRMLALAEAKREPGSAVRFRKGSLDCLDFLEGESIDFAFSSTSLHYLEDLVPPMKELARVLKPEARAILSVMHPLYTGTYPIEGGDDQWRLRYLDRRPRAYRQPWTKPGTDTLCRSAHHTFSDYMRAITSAGLTLRSLHEPGPPDAWRESERWRAVMEEPIFAVFECEKRPA